jgi:sugar O-acyltransferase (sialic acid O-acetyltransferase NeuD family)
MKTVVFGGAGAATIVAMTLERIQAAGGDASIIGFLNDIEPIGKIVAGIPVIGRFQDWQTLDPDIRYVAPLHRFGKMRSRFELIRSLNLPENRWALAIVDPLAAVALNVTIGSASVVAAGSHVLPGARLGRHVFVRNGACLSHDVRVADFVYIGANTVVSGNVQIGEGAYIGPQSVLRDGITIGAYATVAIGAVISKDIEENGYSLGGRARSVGRPSTEEG